MASEMSNKPSSLRTSSSKSCPQDAHPLDAESKYGQLNTKTTSRRAEQNTGPLEKSRVGASASIQADVPSKLKGKSPSQTAGDANEGRQGACNSSEPLTPNIVLCQYVDRFGTIRSVSGLLSQSQHAAATTCQEKSNSAHREQFKAFGIEAYPTTALFNEICRDFVINGRRCHHGSRCHRVHPLDKLYYRNQIPSRPPYPSTGGLVSYSKDLETEKNLWLDEKQPHNYERDQPKTPQVKLPSSDVQSLKATKNNEVTIGEREMDDYWDLSRYCESEQYIKAWTDGSSNSDRDTSNSSPKTSQAKLPSSDVQSLEAPMNNKVTVGERDMDDCWDLSRYCESEQYLKAWTDGSSSSDGDTSNSSLFSVASTGSSQSSASDDNDTIVDEHVKPPSKFSATCLYWLYGNCRRGATCCYRHGDIERYNLPVDLASSSPLFPVVSGRSSQTSTVLGSDTGFKNSNLNRQEICRDWLRGNCARGRACLFRHVNLECSETRDADNNKFVCSSSEPYQTTKGSLPLTSVFSSSPPAEKATNFPPPKYDDICRLWLRGSCSLGPTCRYRHGDIDYAETPDSQESTISYPNGGKVTASTAGPKTARIPDFQEPRKPPEILSTTVHNHIKVKLAEGFVVEELITGFESSFIFLSNLPPRVIPSDVEGLLQPHGTVTDIRKLNSLNVSTITVKACMSTQDEAARACAALNGRKALGTTLNVKLAVNDPRGGDALFRDTAIRIHWEAPGKVAYCGYPSQDRADKAIEDAARIPYGDSYAKANIHVGLPAVGVVTVRFVGLPLDADEEGLKKYAQPEDVMWERPNYKSLQSAISGIRRILTDRGTDLLEFVVRPPPYGDGGIVRAWAHFSSPSDAKAACSRLHGRKPAFTGLTKIFARHLKSISYKVKVEDYKRALEDLHALSKSLWAQDRNKSTVTAFHKEPAATAIIRLSGEDVKELRQLKLEVDRILMGEVVKEEGKVAWDDFFSRPGGISYLRELEHKYSPCTIQRDLRRRMIRLFGSSATRALVGKKIVDRLSELRLQRVHVIPLDGRFVGVFMSAELMKLQEDLGVENVTIDLWKRTLHIRGDEIAYKAAMDVVNRARQFQRPVGSEGAGCPVCFEEASVPVRLPCGHAWCRSCLQNYLTASIEQNFFPLTCLGNDDAKCTERISLTLAREILSVNEFDAVVNSAVMAHVHTHPKEFHYCPSPDCPQVYRASPHGTVLQCPSCLIRICASCQTEAHDGLSCSEADGGDELFKEWVKKHDAKCCPGCNIVIERSEGCNHVTCTQCNTHVCWVCMKTFPGGEGIYAHMSIEHGGYGLGLE